MAGILKAIKGGNAHACSSLENYLTDIKKLIGNEAIGIDCDPYTFDSDFAFDRIEHSVDKKARAYVHYTLSKAIRVSFALAKTHLGNESFLPVLLFTALTTIWQ